MQYYGSVIASGEFDYPQLFSHLENLTPIAIMPTGRSGSDYLQSLLEGHPNILTFNGHFLWHEQFYGVARSVLLNVQNPVDVINEFVGLFLYKLVSKYDVQEGKHRLGENRNESIQIDLDEFRFHVIGLIKDQHLNSRNWLLSIYGAYSLCLKRDITETKVFLHHPHLELELRLFAEDFPETKVLFTVRDTRASLFSQIDNFRRYYPDKHDSESHLYESLQMNLRGSQMVQDLGLETVSVRLEDLPREDILRRICLWMNITWDSSLLSSTWGGLEWHGDSLSKRIPKKNWSKNRTHNDWEKKLTRRDQLLIRACTSARLVQFGYEKQELAKIVKLSMLFVALFPMSLELRYFGPRYIAKSFGLGKIGIIQILESPLFYFKRVKLCWKFILSTFKETKSTLNWIKI
jgi:hypothetical protein